MYELQMRSWFHGVLSSVQAEQLLGNKAKGTFLIRFSSSNPGSFAISVLNDDGIKHYKIWHQPGKHYIVGKDEYSSLDSLIRDRRESLLLKFPCPKGEKYSDSNFWLQQAYNEDDRKAVISLKNLCFRFIYRNSQLFRDIRIKMPLDLMEEYFSTIVDSITSDMAGRNMWKVSFLGRDCVSWKEFSLGLYKFLGVPLNEDDEDLAYRMLHAIVQDIADNKDDMVTVETFSKFLEWFGPLEHALFARIFSIVSKNWFHGNMSHVQAEKLIQKNSSAKKGSFLIRFSSKNRGYFTITVVGRKKSLLHYRVYYNRNTLEYIMGKKIFQSLDEIIQTYHRELCLRFACTGSKFQKLQYPENNQEYVSD